MTIPPLFIRSRHMRVQAFTLIELLVVISIVALLLAFLVPALSQARNEAKVIVCAARQRQIAVAYIAYTLDSKDHVPRPLIGNSYAMVPMAQWSDATLPVGIGALYAKSYMADGKAGMCSDHPWASPSIAKSLNEAAAYGKYLTAPSGSFSYIFRAPYSESWLGLPGNGNQVINSWPNKIYRWDSYILPIATKLQGNLQGGEFLVPTGTPNQRLITPIALFSCAVGNVYYNPGPSVHQNKGYNAAFADGTVFRVKRQIKYYSPTPVTDLPARWSDTFFNFADQAYPGWVSQSAYDNLY